MTNTAIVGIVFGAIAVIALAALAWTGSLGPLKHRGEAAEGHADDIPGADEACALTLPQQPLETVPPIRHPGLWDFEQEMAGTPAARLATRLDNRSTR